MSNPEIGWPWLNACIFMAFCGVSSFIHVCMCVCVWQVHLVIGVTSSNRLECLLSQDWIRNKLASWPKNITFTWPLMGKESLLSYRYNFSQSFTYAITGILLFPFLFLTPFFLACLGLCYLMSLISFSSFFQKDLRK